MKVSFKTCFVCKNNYFNFSKNYSDLEMDTGIIGKNGGRYFLTKIKDKNQQYLSQISFYFNQVSLGSQRHFFVNGTSVDFGNTTLYSNHHQVNFTANYIYKIIIQYGTFIDSIIFCKMDQISFQKICTVKIGSSGGGSFFTINLEDLNTSFKTFEFTKIYGGIGASNDYIGFIYS